MAASWAAANGDSILLENFQLYKSSAKFYIFGCNKNRTYWRILNIDVKTSLEPNFHEDFNSYSESECTENLRNLERSGDGLQFVSNFYGIIGIIKFLGPYYMILITDRAEIGSIFGHKVYQVTKTEMVELSSYPQSNLLNLKDEDRYMRLFYALDLTKDFFFSYSYHIMKCLQKNFCDAPEGHTSYDSMFVWNEFLTREIRNSIGSTIWTVALVYGFFKQDKLLIEGREIILTLIARRSRHYAGTRYLKRGVNGSGSVANDVETEQIVFENIAGENPAEVSSIVQNRGSIPLFWSQETSKLNLKPDITLHRKDKNYDATRLHFKNLLHRYGAPIIVLNLIKKHEKKPRESILRNEFYQALKIINKDLPEENHLRFLHWDLHMNLKSKSANVLIILLRVAYEALNLTGFFCCRIPTSLRNEASLHFLPHLHSDNTDDNDALCDGPQEHFSASSDLSSYGIEEVKGSDELCVNKPPKFQSGVLRTNCIDCLDRTNVAQYAYGLVALGHQLCELGLIEAPKIDLDTPLARRMMRWYEKMGDTLSLQYGGSAAHNKVFSHRRGHLKFVIQSQEFIRTLQRYYNNAYMDTYKQAAINLFLGDFQPQQDKPAIWELESENLNLEKHGSDLCEDNSCSGFIKRTESDGSIVSESSMSLCGPVCDQNGGLKSVYSDINHRETQNALLDSTQDSGSENDVFFSRYMPPESDVNYLSGNGIEYTNDSGDSNFFDVCSLSDCILTEDEQLCAQEVFQDSANNFANWVNRGGTFWY